jgi:hypothetical protein
MKNLALELGSVDWLEQAALGPFSFRFNRTRLTHCGGVTFFASTYCEMIRLGWAKLKEVA